MMITSFNDFLKFPRIQGSGVQTFISIYAKRSGDIWIEKIKDHMSTISDRYMYIVFVFVFVVVVVVVVVVLFALPM